MTKLTTAEFIKRARQTHGRKYDYTNTEYVNAKTKVRITCKEHGDFWQIPWWHMDSQGCPACGGTKRRTLVQFIQDARKVHGDKYDYSKSVYLTNKQDIIIACPIHGEFYQSPDNHLAGKGCLHCGQARIRTHKYKDVTVQGKRFRVQGYEHFALKYIVKKLGVRASQIKTGKRIPTVAYSFGKRERMHYPDMWIPEQNRLVEIKSPWTLGIIGAYVDKPYFEEVKAKRAAAVAAGYEYSLLVFNGKGERVPLPKNWHTLTKAQMRKYLKTLDCSVR